MNSSPIKNLHFIGCVSLCSKSEATLSPVEKGREGSIRKLDPPDLQLAPKAKGWCLLLSAVIYTWVWYKKSTSIFLRVHELWTSKEVFFHWHPNILGLGRQIGQINSGAFVVFSSELSAPILVQRVPCPCFPLFNNYFYKKTKPLYPHPKYLCRKIFGIGVWIWASKN